jgi:hypothetical protein
MDHQEWVYTPDHDEYVVDHSVVLLWDYLLVLWKDIQEVDAQFKSPQYVSTFGISISLNYEL